MDYITSVGAFEGDMADKLIEKIASCDNAYFKSQQIGDPDLTFDEKRKIVKAIFDKGPSQVLRRFNQHLNHQDLEYFEPFKDDYEVNFYIKAILERSQSKNAAKIVKNRRYSALQKLIKDGVYFSDYEMRERNPQMFEQFIGQYMSKQEKEDIRSCNSSEQTSANLSSVLLSTLDRKDESEFIEEFDTDDSDDEQPSETQMNVYDRSILRDEFTSNMHQRFLDGLDNFDYSSVDENNEYDLLEVVQQDAEDKYFDSDD